MPWGGDEKVLEANTSEECGHLKHLIEKEKNHPGKGEGQRKERRSGSGREDRWWRSFLGQAAHGARDGDPKSLSASVLSPFCVKALSSNNHSGPSPGLTVQVLTHPLVPRGWQLRGTAPLPSNPHVFLSDDVKATSP